MLELTTEYQKKIHRDRYHGDTETILETYRRVAKFAANTPEEETMFYEMLVNDEHTGAGRILSNSRYNNMVYNCFVLPIEDSRKSIIKETLSNFVETASKGGGIGINFSPLRPKGTFVKGSDAVASGPCSFIDIYQATAAIVKQGGSRGLACMGILSCDHPDIYEFIQRKAGNDNVWNNFNVSVAITNDFMEAVEDKTEWNLKFDGKVYDTIQAVDLWDEICKLAWQSGEPGIIFLDTINEENPIGYLVDIQAVNPCQPADSLLWDRDQLRRIDDENAITWTSWCSGIKEVVEISTNTGLKFKCTPEHKVLLKDGSWCKAAELIGKVLQQPKNWVELLHKNFLIHDFSWDNLQILRGFLFGDGFLCGRKQGISVKLDPEKEPEVASLLENNGFHRQKSGVYYINRIELEKRIDVSFLKKHTYDRELPLDVLYGNFSYFVSFLRGLFAANGSCNHQGQSSLKTINYPTAQKVQILLGSLGIHASICANKPQKIKWDNGEYISKKSYNVQIPPSYGVIFEEIIGFIAKAKRDNVRISLQNRVKIVVKSVESLGEMEVWDYKMKTSPHYNYCQGTILSNCGEQPLPPYGACNLGSLILPTFFHKETKSFDYSKLKGAIGKAVRFHDNLIDKSKYPLPENKEIALTTRPIGIGVMGLADLLFLLEMPYGNYPKTLEFAEDLFKFIQSEAVFASEKLAEEKGPFPAYDSEKAKFLPRRNSTLISYAPTGTISRFNRVSWGIEPHFAPVMTSNDELGKTVCSVSVIEKWLVENNTEIMPEWTKFTQGGTSEQNLTTEDHLAMLKIMAKYCCSGVSKTINMPNEATVEDISYAYKYCWKNNIKGCTIYREGSRLEQAVDVGDTKDVQGIDEEDYDIEFIGLTTHPKERPPDLEGYTYRIRPNPSGPSLYVTINDFEEEPYEIFFKTKNAEQQEILDMLSRALTSLLRRGISAKHLIEEFKKYESPFNSGSWYEGKYIKSLSHAVGLIMEKHYKRTGILKVKTQKKEAKKEKQKGGKCPECQEYSMYPIGGCPVCILCGYSSCS